jgi:diguanylate cyclase (GGDEF)-like protein/PAS domain S-box-containing protein
VNLLLVEDNPGDVWLFKEFLKTVDHGSYLLNHDSCVSDCLDRLDREPTDLIFLDLSLPDAVGLETLEKVRQAKPKVPIIVLSGNRDENLAEETKRYGAQDFLVKGQASHADLMRSMAAAIENRRLIEKLEEAKQRYELFALGAHDGLWDCNLETKQVYYSPRWKSMLGYDNHEIIDTLQEWHERIHTDDRNHVIFDLSEHFAQRTEVFANKHRLRHKDGGYRWVLCRGVAVYNDLGRPVRIGGSFTDITELTQLEQKVEQQSFYDSITHLPNRTYFMENLHHTFVHAKQNPDCRFAVLFLDMNRIKEVNDNFGHQAGDLLLSEFTKRLSTHLRPTDLAAHIGGDRFTVLLNDIKDFSEAVVVADKIASDMEYPFIILEHLTTLHEITLTVHCGIAYSSWGFSSANALVRSAEGAIQQAKSIGKTRFEVYEQKREK